MDLQPQANARVAGMYPQHMRPEDVLDMVPNAFPQPGMQVRCSHAAVTHAPAVTLACAGCERACMQDLNNGGASRLVSGMSIEGFIPEHGNALVLSRNTSGLDTMQSIEQALPDGDGAPVQ
jgi:hypothetical protein